MVTAGAQHTQIDESYLSLLMDPSYIVNDEMIITWANEAYLKEFNLKKTNIIGKLTCEETCPSQLCGTKNCPIKKAKRLKKGVETEVLHANNGSDVSWFTSRANPLPGNGGTLVSLNDITKEKELYSRLQQMETDLNVIPTPIMEIDDKFNITFMNPAGAAVAGKNPDEVIGTKCYDLFKTPHCKTEKCACA